MGTPTEFDEQFVLEAANESIVSVVGRKGEDRKSIPAQRRGVDPPVPASRNRLDEPRVLRVVTKRCTQALDRGIQAVLEIDKSSGGPKLPKQLVALNHLARSFQQQSQNLQRLPSQRHARVPSSQFPRAEVEKNRFALNRRPLCNRDRCWHAHRYNKRYRIPSSRSRELAGISPGSRRDGRRLDHLHGARCSLR